MKAHLIINNPDGSAQEVHKLESANPEGIKPWYLEEIKPTDSPITKMLKGWARNVRRIDDVAEYHGIVLSEAQKKN